jgi:hypothetical protein
MIDLKLHSYHMLLLRHGNSSQVEEKGAHVMLVHVFLIMGSVPERWTPWSVGKVSKEMGEQVGTSGE